MMAVRRSRHRSTRLASEGCCCCCWCLPLLPLPLAEEVVVVGGGREDCSPPPVGAEACVGWSGLFWSGVGGACALGGVHPSAGVGQTGQHKPANKARHTQTHAHTRASLSSPIKCSATGWTILASAARAWGGGRAETTAQSPSRTCISSGKAMELPWRLLLLVLGCCYFGGAGGGGWTRIIIACP